MSQSERSEMALSRKVSNVLLHTYTRLARRFTEDGVVRGGAHLLANFARKVARYECVYLYSRAKNETISSDAISKLTGLFISEASRKAMVKFECSRLRDSSHYRKKAFEGLGRFKIGHKCFLAGHEGRFIAKAWIAEADTWFISEVETHEKIGPESIIIFDCATIPQYRGKRVYRSLLKHIIHKYPDRRKVIYCEKWNVSSMRAIQHDFILEKKLYLFKILGATFRWSRQVAQATSV